MFQSLVCCVVFLLLTMSAFGQTAQDSTDCTEVKAQAARAEAKLKDWPALARYRDDNGKVLSPAKGEKRVVFLGDSITDGWDNPVNGGFFPGKPYIDRGISGQTTPQSN